jgi:heptosyltransferase-2
VQRALILKFGAISDVIMALFAVHLLHEAGMQIDWVCGRGVRSLLEYHTWLQLIRCDGRAILGGTATERAGSIFAPWPETFSSTESCV